MIKIVSFVVGDLKTNCHLIINNNSCLILDPGDDADYLASYIQRNRLKPLAIVASHGHFDHLMGVEEIKLIFDIPFYINKKDNNILSNINSSFEFWTGKKSLFKTPTIDRDIRQIPQTIINFFNLKVINTPGHTPGSVSIVLNNIKSIFVGDLLFGNNMIGRYDFSYSDKNLLFKSIKTVKNNYQGFTAYPGHGDSFTI